jgi:hypothetical protein
MNTSGRLLRVASFGCYSLFATAGTRASDEKTATKSDSSSAVAPASDEVADTERLSKLIEDAVDDYQLYADPDSSDELTARPVIRWRNAARGQDGEAMLVIWLSHGHPLAMASIYPWAGDMKHEFDLLARKPGLVAKAEGQVIWSPGSAGVEFRKVPKAKAPGTTPAARLRDMKALAERFEGTMTGWNAADSDNETLRLLPRPIYRYEISQSKEADDIPLDGALFAFTTGTDPEIVLVLEAVGNGDSASWEYACVRATSGGLEMRLDGATVWTAGKFPVSSQPGQPHFTSSAPLPVED